MSEPSEPGVLVAGEALIDFIPGASGPLRSVERFDRRAGGAPANVAVGLARLEETPWFWTRVGDDPFGAFLRETLREEGLPERFVERDPDAKTSLAFVSHDPDADRAFTFYRDDTADTRMQPGAVPDDVLDRLAWVHVGGVTLTGGASRDATLDLARRAGERGCTVSFDPNARPELWESSEAFATLVHEMLAIADVVKATPADLREAEVPDAEPFDLARSVCDRGPHTTLLTLGRRGAVAVATGDAPWPGEAAHPGYAVDPVDTTGAGDAFTAGAIASLVGGGSLEEAVGLANAVAAATTTAPGAMTALPDREAVRAFRESTPRSESRPG